MYVHRLIVLVIGVFLLVSIVGAADLTPSTIKNSNSDWLVANGNDVSTITVHVKQVSSPTDVNGATVTFSIPDANMGTITPASVITSTDGIATAVFKTGTKSGNATINAAILYNDPAVNNLLLTTFQRVDHDTAQIPYYDLLPSVPVGSITHLNITLIDRSAFENRIENINTGVTHTVHLTMSGVGGSGFFDGSGYVPQIDKTTDAEGNISVNLRVSTVAGDNIIQMDPIGNIILPSQIHIEGIGNPSTPYTITQTFPSPTSWTADGYAAHTFDLYYTVRDQYENPVDGTVVLLTSYLPSGAVESTKTITTYNGGVAYTPYGPKDVSGIYTIKATTPSNASILCNPGTVGYCVQTVEYYSMNPVTMVLSASPQTLVSTDVDPTSLANVRGRVMDVRGNPVTQYPPGTPVTVSFSFVEPADILTYSGITYTETTPSSLSSNTATMGADGFATVQFIPGKFVSTSTEPLYNATAMGTRTVRASWTDPTGVVQTHDVLFTWKNYPFLTISSSFSSTIAKVGDPIYITIKIKGDGAGFQPKPIDVVLAMDRSGSMLEANPDNMVTAKGAASTFASSLTYGKDNIGIVSFGDNSATSGWVNLSPTSVPYWNSGDCTHYNKYHHCDAWGPGYWTTAWEWDNVYGNWYWVADDGSYECGTGCDGHSDSSYDPTSAHQVYLNTNYNNGKSRNYGTTSFASTDLSRGPHSYSEVTDALNTMIAAGGTPTREGIYNAVNQFPADDGKKVRAIILQTDGVWNTGGNPEGASDALSLGNGVGTGSVITYANNSKVALYVIGLGVGSGTDLETTLKRYAKNDAGLYYSASDASKLSGIYTDIAGQLNQVASGSTSARMNFGAGTISVDGTILGSSADVDKYINYSASPVGGRPLGQGSITDSTYVYKFHSNVDGSTTDYYKQVRDDTQNWTATTKLLTFDVGKMMLNDSWQTTIKLNLTKSGQLVLFPDCHSTVTFIDSSTGVRQDGCIPAGPLSVYESKTNEAFGVSTLKVENLGFVAGTNPDPNIWKISWDTTYTGTTVAEETIEYWDSESGSVPTTYSVISPIHADPASVTRTLEIDTTSWEKGSTYTIKVSATSYDGGSSYATITKTKDLDNGKIFINLK